MATQTKQTKKQIALSPWQSEVWKDTHRYKVINIGRRGGKTYLAATKIADFAAKKNKAIVWYLAPNYKQAKSIMWEMLKDVIPRDWIEKTNETELKLVLKNGSQILLKGSEDPDSLRGVKIDLVMFDEVAFFAYWQEVWKVLRPTMVDSKAEGWFISTPNGFNHFKELSETDDPDYKYFHYTSYDNPYLDKAELDKTRAEMDEDSFAQEFLGEFRRMSGLIYKEFNQDEHMVDLPEIPDDWTWFESLDFGYEHRTAYGQFAVNPTGTVIYMVDGFYQKHFAPSEIAEAIKIKRGNKRFNGSFGDNQRGYIEELKLNGVSFTPVTKGPDSVKAGIAKVAGMLRRRGDTGRPTLMFNKNLRWVADEADRYRWLENKSDGHIKDTPLKRDDDAMDMIRYFVVSFREPVEVDSSYALQENAELFEGGWY